ncbi:tripartite tricarboxylate transporter substrate binding protein [Ectothiorhodospiraceae bacterium WFHF3C12]|nr:tripartite tricarboxylate transporter substrate binding protein [Ectothiorhodospiraceae bacterium WFHF3C12]
MPQSISKSWVSSLAALVVLAVSSVAGAAEYPTKPVTVIVPFGAGGSTDLMARATAREFKEFFDQNIVVDNRSGGAGTVGMAALAREDNDGYTVGIVPAAPLVNQPHMRKTPYDLESFEYVCQLFYSPQALAVKPGSQFDNLNELVDYAKENPGELTYGTPGPGSLPHLAMEQFLQVANVKIEHIPFTGDAQGATSLMGGHIDLYMTMPNVIEDRDFKSIGVFSEEPVESMPEVKTATSQGFDMTAAWWGGLVAPKGIPEQAKSRLVEACQYTVDSERFQKTLNDLGTLVQYRGPEDFIEHVHAVSKTNGKLINTVLKGN